ncbi:unnamed protein product, partial [Rotaria sp. Silwood2]
GKRDLTEEEARFLESLAHTMQNVFSQVLQKPLEQAMQSGALMLAQVLAGVGTNGINLSNIFGKRDLTEEEARFLESLAHTMQNVFSQVLQKPLEQAMQ